jgi:hypothetical protein
MSALSIQVPFPVFQDRDGQPLDNGYVWIGTANLNPQTNPVVAYYDAALTIVAVQPLRTLNGFISRAGTPAQVYVDGVNFSILVQDSKGSMVYNFPDGSGISPNASGIVYDPAGTGAVATTVQTKLRQYVSAKDFGVVGDGSTDDTTAIQAFLNAAQGKTGLLNSGTYLVNDTLLIKTNTILVGEGFSNSIIVAGPNLGNKAIFLNQNYTGTLNVYTDVNISVSNIGFNGNNITVTGPELVAFGKVNGLIIDSCKIYNRPYIGLSLGGCLNFNVTNSEFTNCGKVAVTSEGGAALYIASAGDGTRSNSGTITNNYIHDNRWAGIYANGDKTIISQNNLISNKEAGIFQTGNNNIINDNKIVGVTRQNISASGIESGGYAHIISNNYISDVDASCIALTDVQGSILEGNYLSQAARDNVYYPQGAGISIITTLASPNQPRDILIGNNKYASGDAKTYSAVDIGNAGAAPVYIVITANDFSGVTYSSGQAIKVAAGKSDTTQVFRDNIGAFDIFDYGGYVQGRYYAGESLSPTAAGTLTISANTIYATPFAIRQQQVWNKIAIYVSTAQAGASAYLGVYRMENGKPTTLVGTPGIVSLATTGLKELTVSEMLQQGMYALFVLPDVSGAIINAGTLSSQAIATVGTSGFGVADTLITAAYTYGALPATFPTVVYATGSSPLIMLRWGA